MPGYTRDAPEGYMTMAQARARLGVSKMTMLKLLERTGVQTYNDPRDGRVKLLRIEDVDQMARPTPSKIAA